MAAAATRVSAWSTSLAVHAAIAVALMAALGRGHRHQADDQLARLVYVEPVAPPLAGSPVAGPPVVEPQAAPPQLKKEQSAPAVRRPLPTLQKSLPTQRRPVEPPPARAHPVASAEPAVASPPADGATAGSVSGVAGGAVGGLGDVALPLRAVAAPPELVARVLPDYPARARAMQIEGQVVLEVVLDRNGRIEDAIRVVHSIPALDAAAIAAVKQWRFRPARDGSGRAVRVLMEVPVRFVLR